MEARDRPKPFDRTQPLIANPDAEAVYELFMHEVEEDAYNHLDPRPEVLLPDYEAVTPFHLAFAAAPSLQALSANTITSHQNHKTDYPVLKDREREAVQAIRNDLPQEEFDRLILLAIRYTREYTDESQPRQVT